MEDLMREELAIEGCIAPKQQRYADELGYNCGSLTVSPLIAAEHPGMGTIRGVARERGVRGPPDLRSRPAKPAASSAPRYNVTVEELEGMIRHGRLAHSGSTGLAHSRMARRMLCSIRSTLMIRIARILLDMPLYMALDIATGVGMVRDIGVGREACPYPPVYLN